MVQDKLLRDVADGLRDVSQEGSCLRPGERHRIAVRLLTAPDDVDGRQCLLALIKDEVQVCASFPTEEEEAALRDIAHRLDDDGLASCGKAVESKAPLTVCMRSEAKLRIADSEDCPLDRSAMRVGDPTTELCCSRRCSLSSDGIWGSYGQ